MYLRVYVHAFKHCQQLLTASQSLIFFFSPDFQLLLFIVTALMFLQLGLPFNYNVYDEVRYLLPWLRA